MTRQTQHVVQCDMCNLTVTYDDGQEFVDFAHISIAAPPAQGCLAEVERPLIMAHTCRPCTIEIIRTIRKMRR